jgi:glycolate dehydrogenase iron-sulfur subunit
METHLTDKFKNTPDGLEAEAILRKCVHCGFCLATCPTYQLLGDELDSPRGRIYLMKQVLEGRTPTAKTQLHLDRCLTCRNCETTCPSGVKYGALVDIGRKLVEERVLRAPGARLFRTLLAGFLTRRWLFDPAMYLGQLLRPVLPRFLKDKVPARRAAGAWPARTHARRMLVLDGCVQPAMSPNINAAAARVLDALGVRLFAAPNAGCCGGIRFHMNAQDAALDEMRHNINAWWPHIEAGAEAIVITASGCGVTVKEYGHHLRLDPAYAEKAARVSALTKDLSEVLPAFQDQIVKQCDTPPVRRVAWHAPCTLQHGQQLRGGVEALLRACGVELVPVADSHLCCGSAGTYSILQPKLATELRERKLANLEAAGPEMIVSANIGCIAHLQGGTGTPVRHWIELIDAALRR